MPIKLFFAFCLCALGLLAGPTSKAAKIYKCAGPSGSTVFSETSCGKDAQELDVGPTESLPRAVETAPPLASAPAVKTSAEPAVPTPSFAPTDFPSYRCSTPDGMVFYRHQHCPKHVQVTLAGVYGNIPTETQTFAPVEEAGVSRDVACKAIYPLVAAHRYGEQNDEQYSTVERNKARTLADRSTVVTTSRLSHPVSPAAGLHIRRTRLFARAWTPETSGAVRHPNRGIN